MRVAIFVRPLWHRRFGTLELIGLNRFDLPAEYVAAMIAMFVHPSNVMVACRWLDTGGTRTADAMGNPNIASQNNEPIHASQIFALVIQILDNDDVIICKNQFEARTNLAIVKTMQMGDSNEKTSQKK